MSLALLTPVSTTGRSRQTGSPHCKVEGSLRGKRSDPSHGANARPKAGADPARTVPMCRTRPCKHVSTSSGV